MSMGSTIVGRCNLREAHPAHVFDWQGSTWRCPGQHAECPNCDDRLCMDCVMRYHHDECEENCPECCGEQPTLRAGVE